MLRTLLELNGYEVTTVPTAREGLEALRQSRFHLVIADYNLPDEDGATMLSRAAAEGRLNCESVILTGAYRLGTHATAFRVMRKPIDATTFLAKLDELLAPIRETELASAKTEVGEGEPDVQPTSDQVDLVLYVSEASRASLRAIRRIRTLLDRYDPSSFRLRIIDISRERPASFDEDRITFTPTLVKRHPRPRVYFLGAFDQTDDLVDLLGEARPKGEDST